MLKKNPLVDSFYSKTKQFPPIRYARYWQVPYHIAEIAYFLYGAQGYKMSHLQRFLQTVNSSITRGKVRGFVRACNLYKEVKHSKTLLTQLSAKRDSKNMDYRSKYRPKLGFLN